VLFLLGRPLGYRQQCRNGHLLYGEDGGYLASLRTRAREQHREPSRCPQCRVELPEELRRCLVAEQRIALLPATCRHCTAATTRGALASHEMSCPSANVNCMAHAVGCKWTGRESDRVAHGAEYALTPKEQCWRA